MSKKPSKTPAIDIGINAAEREKIAKVSADIGNVSSFMKGVWLGLVMQLITKSRP